MITSQVLSKSLSSLQSITKIGISLYDVSGNLIASASGPQLQGGELEGFINSQADSQESGGMYFYKVSDEEGIKYILALEGGRDEAHQVAKICAAHILELSDAYNEKNDKGSFFQNLILDNLLAQDVRSRAKKLKVDEDISRCVYIVSAKSDNDGLVKDLLKGLYSPQGGDVITSVDEGSVILIKTFKNEADSSALEEIADAIVSSLNTEAMISAKVSYGSVAPELKMLSRSYKEAKMAMDVGSIFYAEKDVFAFTNLGIGRLIYQLPIPLCEMFLSEIFDGGILDELDEESRNTVKTFYENNLNISETSRHLFIHRNTLVYRIEKIEKITGLDLRNFDDAVTFKIALLVESYLKYMEEQGRL